MEKIPMVTIKPFRYAGKQMQAGAAFNVQGHGHARLLRAIRVAKDAPPVPAPVPVAVVQEPVGGGYWPAAEAEDEAMRSAYRENDARVKRTYKRKDLTAEEP